MKKNIVLFLFMLVLFVGHSFAQQTDKKMDKFITNLMKQMTIDEKIGQLNFPGGGDVTTGEARNSNIAEKVRNGQVGAILSLKGVNKIKEIQRVAVEESRMKIPLFFAIDVIHGYETGFPIPLAISATWNMNAIEESARIAAKEVSADGIGMVFSPMVDITRDPRWGRVSEGSGEDPYLGGEIAKAMVKGYQGDNTYSTNSQVMACVKHFALYGASEAGLDYNTVDMSRQRMFNEYMYPYQAAVDAGVGSVMASLNDIEGIPASANKWLLTDVLRRQWGFKGVTTADYTSVSEMVNHGIGDLQTVVEKAIKAGLDLDMISESYITTMRKSYDEGKVSKKDIERSCRYVLEAKYKLGLFDDPYKFCNPERLKTDIYTPAHRDFARELASESFVLLKNDNHVLPLKKKGTIAVVGPLANTRSNMPGTWSVSVDLTKPATVVEGIQEVGGKDVTVLYAKGSHLTADPELEKRATMFGRDLGRDKEKRSDEEMLQEALDIASKSDVVVAALGEASEFSGESSSRTDLNIPEIQQKLLQALLNTGKPIVLLVFDGRPLTLSWEAANIPTILNVWFGGSEAAYAIGDVLFGDVNPSGKLTMTFPKNVGQIPIFYNHKNTGRPLRGEWFTKFQANYIDVDNKELYPFGYGLSYSKFAYSNPKLSADSMNATGSITASVTVTNTSGVDGKEVVQLYLRDLVASITRPIKELKGFEKIDLKAGESKTVEFEITPDMLKFYNYDLQLVNEPGDFDVMIGGNSQEVSSLRFTYR